MGEKTSVLNWFEKVSAIPRSSGHESALREWLISWAELEGLEHITDKVGNLLIKKKAPPEKAKLAAVLMQAHLDMVGEKNSGTEHNFLTDPIRLVKEGDWLRANETTLGADNGAGVALMLEILADKEAQHPPLECLFTVDEESGLTGALGLDSKLIGSKRLINLDSEEEGVITIGCAGGLTGSIYLNIKPFTPPAVCEPRRLLIRGLHGGHSGTDIHKRLGNSLKILARLMMEISPKGQNWYLQALEGGDKHNAIPREAYLEAWAEPEQWNSLEARLDAWREVISKEVGKEGADILFSIEPAKPQQAYEPKDFARIRDVLLSLPHGVSTFSKEVDGLVESSSNLASAVLNHDTDPPRLTIVFSVRSDKPSLLEILTEQYKAVARLAGAEVFTRDGYPAWSPDPSSPLLKQAISAWSELTGKPPIVSAVHAGLECGVIGEKIPGMDMISIGPDILGAHTPKERMNITSLEKIRGFLCNLLADLI